LVANQWTAPMPVGVGAGFPAGPNLAPAPPGGAVAIASPPAPDHMAGSPALQPVNGSDVIYCSWCGKQRAVNAPAIHYCGSMERPAVYCMNCGTSLEEGAAACSCGTPTTKISR
jgi:hypothetical protein